MDGVLKVGDGAELLDELHRRAHGVERRDLEHTWVVEADDALILILLEQGLKDRSGLWPVLREHVAFPDVCRSFLAGQRRPVECDVANQIEWIKISALGQKIELKTLGRVSAGWGV